LWGYLQAARLRHLVGIVYTHLQAHRRLLCLQGLAQLRITLLSLAVAVVGMEPVVVVVVLAGCSLDLLQSQRKHIQLRLVPVGLAALITVVPFQLMGKTVLLLG